VELIVIGVALLAGVLLIVIGRRGRRRSPEKGSVFDAAHGSSARGRKPPLLRPPSARTGPAPQPQAAPPEPQSDGGEAEPAAPPSELAPPPAVPPLGWSPPAGQSTGWSHAAEPPAPWAEGGELPATWAHAAEPPTTWPAAGALPANGAEPEPAPDLPAEADRAGLEEQVRRLAARLDELERRMEESGGEGGQT
jgi:hypothetical protein